jgi:excisionase family DNA binding protein
MKSAREDSSRRIQLSRCQSRATKVKVNKPGLTDPGVLAPMDTPRTPILFDPLWTPIDAGNFLGIHAKTAIKMARVGQLPALRLGKHWRFRRIDLVAWTESQVKSTCQPVE